MTQQIAKAIALVLIFGGGTFFTVYALSQALQAHGCR